MIVAAVPVKDLVNAKQRLIEILSPSERAALACAMLRDVLRTLSAARLDEVWVVTREPEVGAAAREFGCRVLAEEANQGHTAAVALAQRAATLAAARVFVTVPGDVPCTTADEVNALVAAPSVAGAAAVFVPSRSGLGTNGAALAPPNAMALRFGEPSFQAHLDAARCQGLVPRVLVLRGLGLDIDAPSDLHALTREGLGTESGRLVASWSIAQRPSGVATVRSLR